MNYLVVKCKSTTNLSRRKHKSFYGNTQTIDTFESQRTFSYQPKILSETENHFMLTHSPNIKIQNTKKSFQINLNHTNSTQ